MHPTPNPKPEPVKPRLPRKKTEREKVYELLGIPVPKKEK